MCMCAQTSYTWNEMIVDTRSVEQQLPASVLAFFWIPGSDVSSVRASRDAFAAQYNLAPGQAPVVKLDLSGGGSPFSLDY